MVGDTRKGSKVLNFLEDRFNLSTFLHLAEKKKVPVHKHSFWYYMGGIAAIYLGIQIVTGILLMVYYVPEIQSAHASILKINSQIDFGWFIRSLHSWGANLMIFVVVLHLFSAYFMKAYRKPREFTWYSGLILMVLCLAFGFTGYLLPWDEVSFFATKIGLDVAAKTPLIGSTIADMLRGGEAISQATISRFFVIHVAVLPACLIALLGGHLLLVQMHGMSEPAAFKGIPEAEKTYEKFFPNFFFKDILVWILALNLLFILVTLAPWGIGPEADPFGAAPLGIKPEWYFLAPFQFLKLVPPMVGPIEGELFGILLMSVAALGFVIVPFFDSGQSKSNSNIATVYGVIIAIAAVALSVWGALS
ncbi:MAG: cytochrome b N-terminal domain-containing protein [Candidatus Melainabacteria bacterium]|jgi:cytochrome b6|uniref:Cytochrome b N-terminal domain-containing protein n=1 Tax=Candidatus Obscuribacter phosphatis TaxID=1906157 RepID=A0A8J7PC04_9BACT|nr:cytochrome b N-terminal domain-containing protein [Candidatus Obscuribacter phosphatis]MCA0314977.1 cytochrome b N-terminal domain-containing protein [Candidatus Melainabacteria bacterium]